MAKAKTEGGQPSAKWVLAKIGDIKRNPKNPRTIKDHKFKQLVKSVKEFPEMLRLRPIVVNAQMMVLGGNMRLSACIEAGLKEVPVIVADELTEAQQQEFIIKDNVSFGEWDWAAIGEGWGVEVVGEWGLGAGAWETPPTTTPRHKKIPL
jgi:ParB-like chromosome segregation protein Spo0J